MPRPPDERASNRQKARVRSRSLKNRGWNRRPGGRGRENPSYGGEYDVATHAGNRGGRGGYSFPTPSYVVNNPSRRPVRGGAGSAPRSSMPSPPQSERLQKIARNRLARLGRRR